MKWALVALLLLAIPAPARAGQSIYDRPNAVRPDSVRTVVDPVDYPVHRQIIGSARMDGQTRFAVGVLAAGLTAASGMEIHNWREVGDNSRQLGWTMIAASGVLAFLLTVLP